MTKFKPESCVRCKEFVIENLNKKLICHACQMETKGTWMKARKEFNNYKTGGWADTHEQNY